MEMAGMALAERTTQRVQPQHYPTLHMFVLRYIHVILWRSSAAWLRSTRYIPGSWRYLDFVGEFADHYDIGAQCHFR